MLLDLRESINTITDFIFMQLTYLTSCDIQSIVTQNIDYDLRRRI